MTAALLGDENRQQIISGAVVALWQSLNPGTVYLTTEKYYDAFKEKYGASRASVIDNAIAFHAGQHSSVL